MSLLHMGQVPRRHHHHHSCQHFASVFCKQEGLVPQGAPVFVWDLYDFGRLGRLSTLWFHRISHTGNCIAKRVSGSSVHDSMRGPGISVQSGTLRDMWRTNRISRVFLHVWLW